MRARIDSAKLQNDGNDHAVEAEHFCEDEDQDESHKDLFIHAQADHATLTHQADCVASRNLGQSTDKASTECFGCECRTSLVIVRLDTL